MKQSQKTRRYRMGARAEAAAATGERILDAAVGLFWEQPTDQIRLDEVARRAGVTVQTVIRRFGGKEGLLEAAANREVGRVRDTRFDVTPGDVPAAVSNLLDHYEELGDLVMRLLAEEERNLTLKRLIDSGRSTHLEWCLHVFQPHLAGLSGADRERRVAQLVAICDVYTWKLLRRDSGLSRAETELALTEMLAPFTMEVC